MIKRLLCVLLFLTLLLPVMQQILPSAQAATYTTADWNALRNNYKVSICGDDTVDWTDPEIQRIVGVTNSSGVTTSGISYNGGKYWLDLEKNRSNARRIFGSTNITITVSSDTMRKQFVYLMYMAKAYGTRGSVYTYKDSNGDLVTLDLYQNQELRDAIFYGLQKGSDAFYNYDTWYAQKTSSTASTNYSWWNWAFGAPVEILQTLLVMYPYKTTAEKNTANEIIATCRTMIDTIRPNNDGKTDETTLSNRRTRLRICAMISALKQDTALIEQTRTNLVNFLEKNDGGNGVQADFSYVAHNDFAYEGCYGVQALCERIIGSYYVMSGTAFELSASNKHNQVEWILRTFMPAMHNGTMMMQSNGRFPAGGLSYGRSAITAALQLLGCFEAEDDLQLIQFIRSAVVRDTEEETKKLYSALAVKLGNVMLVQKLKECVFLHNIPEDQGTYAQMRYRNDRAVQHTANYTVGLAMSSRRIATHESINGANRYGWYIGDGALYVYNDKTDITYDQYGTDFNHYANMYRIPGTTEENSTSRKPVSQKKSYFPGMTYTASGWTQAKNKDGVDAGAFVGGVELDGQFIAAAMDFEAYSWTSAESAVEKTEIKSPVERNNLKQVMTSDLTAKKSYFMFDDEIVCVGSDIDFSTRDHSVYTYVDNRELTETTTVNGVTTYGTEDIIVDGVTLEKVNSFTTKKYTDPQWVYAGNFGGYVFPKGGNITIKKAFRESSADGDDTNDSFNDYTLGDTAPNGKHSFLEMWVDHGVKPVNGSYSYVMLPGMTAEETQAYNKSPDITIVKNTTSLHVVKENTLGITAMVFWKAGTYGDITVDKPMIVMVRERDGMYTISASDPTQELTGGTITINRNLHSHDLSSRLTVSGTSKKTLKLNFSGAKGQSITGEFSIADTQQLMFDFNKETAGKYQDNLYGYKNYANVSNWAPMRIATDSLKIGDGKLTFPLTAEKDSSGNPTYWNTYIQPSDSPTNFVWNSNYTDNAFLNFKASNAEIFQVRFKLEGTVPYGNYDPGVYLTYLPSGSDKWSGNSSDTNQWKETIKIPIPPECMKGGSLEGQYVTLTFDLKDKKISTCGTIQAVCFNFGYMREGKATVDYIYLGRKTHSLYFGFGKDGSASHYVEGAYGGHAFDAPNDPPWATACTNEAGGYYKLDPVEGTMTLYTGADYTGTLGQGETNGAYLGTSAASHEYAYATKDMHHPLSYDPSQAEIVEVRFKTEALAAQEGKEPIIALMAVQETAGVTSANSSANAPFQIANGQWQTVQIPINDSLKNADYLKSLGLRFLFTKNQNPGEFARIIVDYIYVGTRAEAPSTLYIGFTNKDTDRERYMSATYGNVNLDAGGWVNSGRIAAPVFSSAGEGTMTLKVNADADQGALYVQASPSMNKPLTMEYDTKNAEVVQLRFKLKNFKAYSEPKVGLYFYATTMTHPMGTDSIKNAAAEFYYPTAEELNRDTYITVTYPVSDDVKAVEKITALRLVFSGIESISSTETGVITLDYIYVGPRAYAPTGCATVTYLDAEGKTLETKTFVKGEAAVYTGPTPTKASTEELHYVFTGWDKDLSKVTENVSVTARFKAENHSYTNGLCICGKQQDLTPVLENGWKLNHTLNLASDISVNIAVSKSLLSGYDLSTVYVESELDTYNGNNKLGTTKITLKPVEQGSYYYFTLEGLTAVQMNDRIRSVLYGTKNGQLHYSPVDDYSIADYAYSQMNKDGAFVQLKTLCADLLRYGAKAQIFKSYRTDSLADANMTDAHRAYLSDIGSVTFGNTNKVLNDLENAPISWAGKALDLESKVALKFVFNPANYQGDPSTLTLKVSYTDIDGSPKSLSIKDPELYSPDMGLYVFTLDALLAAELRSVVSVQIFAGDIPVSCTLQYSADTYGNNKTGNLLELCKALFAYSDSAKAYFQ